MLRNERKSGLVDDLVAEGQLESVTVEGSRRQYLAPAGFLDRQFPEDDGRMRILGPLDPLIWDRDLVRHAFGFDYVWEVYKPAKQRRWGWYVCPLLHEARLVGRIEARLRDEGLVVERVWPDSSRFDSTALRDALERHAAACSATDIVWTSGWLQSPL